MANPFEEAKTLVDRLQTQHDSLSKDIPRLKEIKRSSSEQLAELNKKVVATQEILDNLLEQIRTNTDKYNAWQRGQQAQLEADQAAFDKQKADFTKDLDGKLEKLANDFKALEQAQADLVKAQAQLKRDRTEVNDRLQVNNRIGAKLVQDAKEIEGQRQELINMGTLAGEKAVLLDQREQKVSETEKEAKGLVEAAQRDRDAAKQVLNSAKEVIANNDAREQALDLQEKMLKGRTEDLRKREIALNDRAAVIASH